MSSHAPGSEPIDESEELIKAMSLETDDESLQSLLIDLFTVWISLKPKPDPNRQKNKRKGKGDKVGEHKRQRVGEPNHERQDTVGKPNPYSCIAELVNKVRNHNGLPRVGFGNANDMWFGREPRESTFLNQLLQEEMVCVCCCQPTSYHNSRCHTLPCTKWRYIACSECGDEMTEIKAKMRERKHTQEAHNAEKWVRDLQEEEETERQKEAEAKKIQERNAYFFALADRIINSITTATREAAN